MIGKRKSRAHKNIKKEIVFKIQTPKGLVMVRDINQKTEKDIINKQTIDVIDFGTGKKLGTFNLNLIKLKFL